MNNNLTTQTIVVLLTMPSGNINIMRFIVLGRGSTLPKNALWFSQPDGWWAKEPTEENINYEINRAYAGQEIKPVSWRIVADIDVPSDRTYWEAWYDTGSVINYDMIKAKEIHRNRLRIARKEKLIELDAQWMKAFASGNRVEADAIEAQRQILRDLPQDPAIAAATTIDELKASWPATLK